MKDFFAELGPTKGVSLNSESAMINGSGVANNDSWTKTVTAFKEKAIGINDKFIKQEMNAIKEDGEILFD